MRWARRLAFVYSNQLLCMAWRPADSLVYMQSPTLSNISCDCSIGYQSGALAIYHNTHNHATALTAYAEIL